MANSILIRRILVITRLFAFAFSRTSFLVAVIMATGGGDYTGAAVFFALLFILGDSIISFVPAE
jgi:hypothetical protein